MTGLIPIAIKGNLYCGVRAKIMIQIFMIYNLHDSHR